MSAGTGRGRGAGEERLRALLREVPVPGGEEAERRGLRLLAAAFAERRRPRRAPAARAALAFAGAAVLMALLLSPAGASVRGWIGDVLSPGVPNAEPALTRIPGGGRLAVSSPRGAWVVGPDGSRRLLGDYREATWSPHGLYLAAASGRTLTAVEPDGTPHWSITAPAAVRDPRWSPDGFSVAYRAGTTLRLVDADGTADRLLAPRIAPAAPAWSPLGLPQLAYVDARGRIVVRDLQVGRTLAVAPALPGLRRLEWAASGELLEASARAVRVRRVEARGSQGLRLGPPLRLHPPRGRIVDARLAPDGRTAALVRAFGSARLPRSQVDLFDTRSGHGRGLFGSAGRLAGLSWSPASDRLLVSWPEADQWLFIPTRGRGLRAIAGIGGAFSPGSRSGGAFPRPTGWCCPEPPG